MDFSKLFVPTVSLPELFIRGSVTYLSLFALLRFVLVREAGAVSITDLLVVVLIADAAQNAMAGGYRSITDGLILVATIIFWSYALDWLGYHVPKIGRILRPPPLLLVKNGKILHRNMRRELVTMEELMSELRQAGMEDLSQIEKVYLEGDGTFSVIRKDEQEVKKREKKQKV